VARPRAYCAPADDGASAPRARDVVHRCSIFNERELVPRPPLAGGKKPDDAWQITNLDVDTLLPLGGVATFSGITGYSSGYALKKACASSLDRDRSFCRELVLSPATPAEIESKHHPILHLPSPSPYSRAEGPSERARVTAAAAPLSLLPQAGRVVFGFAGLIFCGFQVYYNCDEEVT
jgi:hypothetical protein